MLAVGIKTARHIVVAVLLERDTHHRVHRVSLGKGLHVVGEVLPLVVDRRRRGVALADVVAALHGVAVERQTGVRCARAVQAIAET